MTETPKPKRHYRMRKHLKDPNLCTLPEKGYGPLWGDPLGNSYPEVLSLYLKLVRAFSPPVEHDDKASDPAVPVLPDVGSFYPRGISHTFHLMTPEQRALVSDLYMAIGAAIHASYDRGLDHGRDLLSQLARAEIKIGDFEQPHKRCRCGQPLPTGNTVCPNCKEEQ
jgi:hypothetical protein